MKHRADRYLQLKAELEENPGFKYLQRRKSHERSIYVFGGNFRQFAELVDLIQTPEFYLKQTPGKKTEELQAELIRLFHNYLAAAKSLVDHTRAYVEQWHAGDEFHLKYQDRIKSSFVDSSVSKMTLDLRNYLMHRGLPPSTIRERFEIGAKKPPEIKILFRASSMTDWKGWSSKSKEYMKEHGSYFELKPLVAEYQNLVSSFYKWFSSELHEMHKSELEKLEALKRTIIEFEQEFR